MFGTHRGPFALYSKCKSATAKGDLTSTIRYDTIRYDTIRYIYVRSKAYEMADYLSHGTETKNNEKLTTKTEQLRRNGPGNSSRKQSEKKQ